MKVNAFVVSRNDEGQLRVRYETLELESYTNLEKLLANLPPLEVKQIGHKIDMNRASNMLAATSYRGPGNVIITSQNFTVDNFKTLNVPNLDKSYLAFFGSNRESDGAILENEGEFQIHPDVTNMMVEIDISGYIDLGF